ncbi:hypothetical protein MPTK1_4g11750 [Marchantia polymorpha subsp. ruderalis]|uniref:Uncharacterized protein n=2 Tax=Marchantia polymorpha TaxID=3197 RepID=A0AAF6B8X9_MARPO|nr:hypothetical protein MARPO_0011s0160 [Marchantia polymorpha]BBN08463.1 hypothetical protein Mp_4g11750 [Marchantia polymorpha subsp. ruderalis]|eukprot:PTQ46499.1 hypothetical protein MARPO_0011s0160 [Marchantia polymorpha]
MSEQVALVVVEFFCPGSTLSAMHHLLSDCSVSGTDDAGRLSRVARTPGSRLRSGESFVAITSEGKNSSRIEIESDSREECLFPFGSSIPHQIQIQVRTNRSPGPPATTVVISFSRGIVHSPKIMCPFVCLVL